MSPILFYPLALLTVISAVGVVATRNPVRSALSLVVTMMLLAVFYAGLGAHLVAALQIMVYAGAVMVLFLFVIMLLNLQHDPDDRQHPVATAGACLGAAVVGLCLAVAVLEAGLPGTMAAIGEDFGTTVVIARQLFHDYLVPFELTSILLLVAVVGAVALAKRDDAPTEDLS